MVIKSDFIQLTELAQLSGYSKSTIYNNFASGTGPLNGILTKFGGRLGCYRADYEIWLARQFKLARRDETVVPGAVQAAA